jgi:hypothetical protein
LLDDASAGKRDDDDEAMIGMPIEDVVPVEVSERVPQTVISRRRRVLPKAAAKSTKAISAKDIEDELAALPKAPSRRKPVRFI